MSDKRKNRRRIFAYERSYQIRYLLFNDTLEIIAMGMTVFIIFFLLVMQLSKNKVFHSAWSDSMTADIAILLVIFCIFIFYRVIIRSHQIAGPFVRLQRQFDEMKTGDISSDFYLRRSDRLIKLAKSFQEMKTGMRGLIQKDRELVSASLQKLEILEKELKSNIDQNSVQNLINEIRNDLDNIGKMYTLSYEEKNQQ